MAANSRAAYALACQCVFAQYVTISASLLGNNWGASSLIFSGGMFTAPGRCASRYRSGESVSTTLMPPLRSSLAFRSCVEIVSSILISSKISLLGYTVLRRLRCKYGAIMLRMASVLQIAPPDAIRRIQRVQTVTIAWMSVEAVVSLFAAWRARSPALLAFGG